MNSVAKIIFASAVFTAGLAYAEDSADPTIHARQELMEEEIAGNVKILGDMASGKTAFDAAAAEAAKAALAGYAAEIPVKFEANVMDDKTEAKPEIWTNWDDFVAKGKALETAAGALDVTSLETLQAGMGAVGGACKDCHTTYRAMK